jgi:hypothetical protein
MEPSGPLQAVTGPTYLFTFTCLFTDVLDSLFIGPLTGPIDRAETSVAANLRSVTFQKDEDITADTAEYLVQQFCGGKQTQKLDPL